MKTKIKKCQYCGEESLHDEGKKQATSRSGTYTRRTTLRCRLCGKKEIVNRKFGRRVVNTLKEEAKA